MNSVMDYEDDRTDYRTFPMDFTNVDSYHQTPVRGGYTAPSPGLFTPPEQTADYDTVASRNYTPKTTSTSQLSQHPTPRFQDSFFTQGFNSSTPIPEDSRNRNVVQQHYDQSSIRWKNFIFKWILTVLALGVTVIAVCTFVQSWDELIGWLGENVIGLSTAVLIIFLVTVICKLLGEYNGIHGKNVRSVSKDRVLPFSGSAPPDAKVRRRLDFEPESTDWTESRSKEKRDEVQVKRTFSGTTKEVWDDFLRYFENVSKINKWNKDRKRLIFLTALRDQAETYVHGLSDDLVNSWESLVEKMEFRFGHSNMKESYLLEARMRKRKSNESFRDLGQAIEDLYRRAYPNSPDTVQENSIKTFLDACSENEEFRLAVRRSRPKTLQEAITHAMEEECIRLSEKSKGPLKKNIYSVESRNSEVNGENKRFSPNAYAYNGRNYNGRRNGFKYRGRPQQRSKDNIVCHGCGETGHYKPQCTEKGSKDVTEVNDSPPVKTGGGTAKTQLNGERSEQ